MIIFQNDSLQIHRFTWNIVDSNSYVIIKNKNALIIDVIESNEFFEVINDCESVSIILTHSHFDHIYGLNKLRDLKPDIIVYSSEKCSENIGNVHRNMSAVANTFISFYKNKRNDCDIYNEENIKVFVCSPAEIQFEGDYSFEWEGEKVLLSQFFGHSNDSIIAVVDDKYMFSGDTILSIPTVTRFAGGSTNKFWNDDIPRLKNYSSYIEMVFPGHGGVGRLCDMIEINEKLKK